MNISREDLDWAASEKLLSPEQATLLWARLEARRSDRSNFGVANAAYYLGALIVNVRTGLVHDPWLAEIWRRRDFPDCRGLRDCISISWILSVVLSEP